MNEKVEKYLIDLTRNYGKYASENFSAAAISKNVGLNRSTTSSYLNQGLKEGLVVKVKGYPVSFLHVKALAEIGIIVKSTEYDSWEDLFTLEKQNALEQVIGAKGSLKEVVDQVKTAVLYPNNGLPILLSGSSGSGKTFLAEKIHEYAVSEKIIQKEAPFIAYNCAQYFNNPELLSSALFGHVKGAFTGAEKDHIGLIEKADNGVLFLDEVHRLSDEGQEKLFTFMDTGEFSPMGDNAIKKKAKVRLIFATTENVYQTFLPTFIRRLPVIVTLPNYEQRPQSERMQLIDTFFINEANILSKRVDVSYQLVDFLLNSDLEGNVGKIKNIVKYVCGSAYAKNQNSPAIRVRLKDLPHENTLRLKEQLKKTIKALPDRQYLPHTKNQVFLESTEAKQIRQLFEKMVQLYQKVEDQEIAIKDFIENMVNRVNNLMDEFMFKDNYAKEESFYSVLTYQIRETFDWMHDNYGFDQDGNRVIALAQYLYRKNNTDTIAENHEWHTTKRKLLHLISSSMDTSYWYAKKALGHISRQLDQDFKEEDLIFISFYFHGLQITPQEKEIKSIILAHGYTTASSMANVGNRMLHQNIFHAYDMPINITLDKVEEQVIRFINDYHTDAGLILLVDMGSLNQLGTRLEDKIRGPLLIIDYVSTPLVLEIGHLIQSQLSISEISQKVDIENKVQKQLILPKKEKKQAILTCCYTGMGSAIQIQEILEHCLEDYCDELAIIPYDYHKLEKNKLYEDPFQMYEVLMIVGTEDPKIQQIPYIGLDHLINGQDIEKFVTILQDYFDISDKELKEQLMFSFSINKIIESLTILDATKLLRLVQSAISDVEINLDITLSNSKLFLLYLHCCCMIERILRKESVDQQEDIDAYMMQAGMEMEQIHRAFRSVENEYTIKISDLELRLIHEIING
ncbi:transcriptional antiterminator [Enterococcus saigonensis]|uniref:Transcriptional antiterminator n=1 Tax=Enterococcus saigonensis TaxID=1805431 RepID=A0A679IR14_9ENTE|nr:sigma 54-interacting transcriptional regulator [Enterococcus saigonensis]BCA85677.1 transcriptional antiterminator [Enterococcus saigonensis]